MFPCDVKAVIYFVPVSAVRKFGTPQLAFHVEKTSADNFRVFFPGRPTRYCVVHKNHTFTISEQIKECVSIIRIWFFKGGAVVSKIDSWHVIKNKCVVTFCVRCIEEDLRRRLLDVSPIYVNRVENFKKSIAIKGVPLGNQKDIRCAHVCAYPIKVSSMKSSDVNRKTNYLNAITDELEIRSLVARYADAVNRRDEGLWSCTWAENGAWALAGTTVQGRASVVEFWRDAMASFEVAIQLVYQGNINIDGNKASGVWYLTETLQPKGADADRTTIGRYDDKYVKENGAWLFASRTYRVLYEKKGEPGTYTGLARRI